MSNQNETHADPARLTEGMRILTQQLALYENEPCVRVSQALVENQTELASLREDIASMKQMIQTLRCLLYLCPAL